MDSQAAQSASPPGRVAAPATAVVAAEAPSTLADHDMPVPPVEAAAAELPRDLSPLGMFMSADIVVKAVMLGLAFASVLTWTVWLAKTLELAAVRRRLRRAQHMLDGARSLAELVRPASAAGGHLAMLVLAAESELRRSPDRHDVAGIKERIAARFGRIEAGAKRQMMRATGIVATIGATAPFVGLFGTVWAS